MGVHFSGLIKPTGRIKVGSGDSDSTATFPNILASYDTVIKAVPDSDVAALSEDGAMRWIDAVNAMPDEGGAIELGEGVYDIYPADGGLSTAAVTDAGKPIAFIGIPGKTVFKAHHGGARDSGIWRCQNRESCAFGITFKNVVGNRSANYTVAIFSWGASGYWYNCSHIAYTNEEETALGRSGFWYDNNTQIDMNVRNSSFAASAFTDSWNGINNYTNLRNVATSPKYTPEYNTHHAFHVTFADPLNNDMHIIADNSGTGVGDDSKIGIYHGDYSWDNTKDIPMPIEIDRKLVKQDKYNIISSKSWSTGTWGVYAGAGIVPSKQSNYDYHLFGDANIWENEDPTAMRAHHVDYFFGEEYEIDAFDITSWDNPDYATFSKMKFQFSDGSEFIEDIPTVSEFHQYSHRVTFNKRKSWYVRMIPWELDESRVSSNTYGVVGSMTIFGRTPVSPTYMKVQNITTSATSQWNASYTHSKAVSGMYCKNDNVGTNNAFMWGNNNDWEDEATYRQRWWQGDFDQEYTLTRFGYAGWNNDPGNATIVEWDSLKLVFSDDSEQIVSLNLVGDQAIDYIDLTPVTTTSVRIYPWSRKAGVGGSQYGTLGELEFLYLA